MKAGQNLSCLLVQHETVLHDIQTDVGGSVIPLYMYFREVIRPGCSKLKILLENMLLHFQTCCMTKKNCLFFAVKVNSCKSSTH